MSHQGLNWATEGVPSLQVTHASAAARISLPPEEAADPVSQGVVDRAMLAVGTRYRWGGTTMNGFDCSGLVKYAYGDRGYELPRTSYGMRASIPNASTLKPGDILFFGWRSASHVGIYIGNGNFVHASYYGVRVDNLARMIPYLGYLGNGRI